jgi:hypothetical protein
MCSTSGRTSRECRDERSRPHSRVRTDLRQCVVPSGRCRRRRALSGPGRSGGAQPPRLFRGAEVKNVVDPVVGAIGRQTRDRTSRRWPCRSDRGGNVEGCALAAISRRCLERGVVGRDRAQLLVQRYSAMAVLDSSRESRSAGSADGLASRRVLLFVPLHPAAAHEQDVSWPQLNSWAGEQPQGAPRRWTSVRDARALPVHAHASGHSRGARSGLRCHGAPIARCRSWSPCSVTSPLVTPL